MRPLFLTLLILVFVNNILAQRSNSQTSQMPTPSPTPSVEPPIKHQASEIIRPSSLRESDSFRTLYETQLGWGVLAFGTLIIGLEIAVMLRLRKGWGTQSIRITGITLVVISGLFLIVTGYSQEQIAPMIGLLGTIVGFLLGKTSKDTE